MVSLLHNRDDGAVGVEVPHDAVPLTLGIPRIVLRLF
jgi:hypothetical protein